jgi:hypothetical protein
MAFDFGSADPWEVSTGTILSAGDHICDIVEIDGSGTSSGGYPQIELRVQNADGSSRDWIVITPSTQGKVSQLFRAVGIDPPGDGEFDPENGRITAKCLDQLYAKKVGVIIRDEPDFKDPTRTRQRIQGYVSVSKIAESDATPNGTTAMSFGGETKSKPDIPF